MATTPQTATQAPTGVERPAGEGPRPPVDALHAHGRVRRRARDPDPRARRGLLRLGRAGQALPRRPVGALLRERRPRPRRVRRGAAKRQIDELGFYTNWSYAHPTAIELAARIAELAPGDLNRVFFTSGGSEAVESAWKLARAYHKLNGEAQRTKMIAREIAYHGTTLGALSVTGITPLRTQFEPLVPGALPRPEHELVPLARGSRPAVGGRRRSSERIEFEGPETIAAVIHGAGAELRRLLHAAGGLLPARARDLRRVRRSC